MGRASTDHLLDSLIFYKICPIWNESFQEIELRDYKTDSDNEEKNEIVIDQYKLNKIQLILDLDLHRCLHNGLH